jgi:cytochrome c-type biogenesis protein CcmH/NrfG
LAICGEQPEDVRALFGLARVAERQGMSAEALDFAQAALAVAPEHTAAADLLKRVCTGTADGAGEPHEGVERRAAA